MKPQTPVQLQMSKIQMNDGGCAIQGVLCCRAEQNIQSELPNITDSKGWNPVNKVPLDFVTSASQVLMDTYQTNG